MVRGGTSSQLVSPTRNRTIRPRCCPGTSICAPKGSLGLERPAIPYSSKLRRKSPRSIEPEANWASESGCAQRKKTNVPRAAGQRRPPVAPKRAVRSRRISKDNFGIGHHLKIHDAPVKDQL